MSDLFAPPGVQSGRSVKAITKKRAQKAYDTGLVARAFKPEVAAKRWVAYQRQQKKIRNLPRTVASPGKRYGTTVQIPTFRAPTEDVLRSPNAPKPRKGMDPFRVPTFQEILRAALVGSYKQGNTQSAIETSGIGHVPGVDVAAAIGGNNVFKSTTLGAGTGVSWIFDALNRLGAPAGAQFGNLIKPSKDHSFLGTYLPGVKATKAVIPRGIPGNEPEYKVLSDYLPDHITGNKVLDPIIRGLADIGTNPASFAPALPVKTLRTSAANAVRARMAERFFGEMPYVPGTSFTDIGKAAAAREPRGAAIYPRTQVPGLPPALFPEVPVSVRPRSAKSRFLRNVQQSPYPAGLVGRGRGGVGPPLTERAAGPTLPGAMPPMGSTEAAAAFARALADHPAFAARPPAASINRLQQRLAPLEETFSNIAGRGVRTPTLHGAKRLGVRVGKKKAQQRTAAQRVAKRISYTLKPPKPVKSVVRVKPTNVPGLVGREAVDQVNRQRKAFGLRTPEASPGGASLGAARAGQRPRLSDSSVPSIRTMYKGTEVETIGRYQVVPHGSGEYRLRDMKQRKWYGKPGTEKEIRQRAVNLRRSSEEKLPPVPEGHVRLYRGQAVAHEPMYKDRGEFVYPAQDSGSEFKGRWFTPDKKMAEHYGQEGEAYYVDVPKSKLDEINQHPLKVSEGAKTEVILPKEYAAKAVRYRRGPTSGAQRSQELAPKKGLPKRVKPETVPYTRHNLPKLKADRQAARDEFRKQLTHKIDAKDLPEYLITRASRLKARTVILEHMILQTRRKLLKLHGPQGVSYSFRFSKERAKLQTELNGAEDELKRTYDKLARILTKGEKGRRSDLLVAYDKYLATQAAEKQAISDVSASIVSGRRGLQGTISRRPSKSTRVPTEGQRGLLRGLREQSRPLSEPPPVPKAHEIIARVDQVMRTPYAVTSTKRVRQLQDDLVALEDRFVKWAGTASRMSPTTAMREGAKIERLRLRLHELQNQMFVKYREWTPEPIKKDATFAQKKAMQTHFTYSEQEKVARAVIRVERKAADAAYNAGVGVHLGFPGFSIPMRVPRVLENNMRKALTDMAGGQKVADFIQATHAIAKDMFVSRYGPNEAVGEAARVLDSSFQVANAHNFNSLREMTIEALGRGLGNRTARALGKVKPPTMTKADLSKLGHWLETGEFDAELSQEAKDFAMKLQGLVERATDKYIQAGGDIKRLDNSYVFHMIRPKEWNRLEELSVEPKNYVFGNDPKFARPRFNPKATLRQLKDEGFNVEENLVLITYMRLLAHNRAMGDLALSRAVSHEFGEKLFRPGLIRIDKDELEIKNLHQQVQAAEKWMGVVQEDPIRGAFQLDKGLYFPEDVVKTLLKLQYIRQENARGAYKLMRRINSWWKHWALFTTGYDIRNQFGDMILGSQAGLPPFRAVIHGLIALKASDKVARSGPEFVSDVARKLTGQKAARRLGPTQAQIRHEAETLGVSQRSALTQETEAHLGGRVTGSSKPVNTGGWARFKLGARRVRQARENVNRLGSYRYLTVSKKTNPYLASRRVNEAYFDYGNVGSAVQRARVSPGGLPFITWLAKNIPAQVKRLPSRTNVELIALNKQLSEQASSSDLGKPSLANQADYLAQKMAIPVPGLNRFAYFGLPQSDLNRLLPVGDKGVGRTIANQWRSDLAPGPSILLSWATDTNPLTGDPTRSRVPASSADLMVREILGQMPEAVTRTDEQGNPIGISATGGMQKLITDTLFPPFGTISRIGKYDAPGQSRTKLGPFTIDPWAAVSSFGGIGSKPIAEITQTRSALLAGLHDKSDKLSAITTHMRDLEAKGIPLIPPTTDQQGFITNIPAPQLRSEIYAYNRQLAKVLEINRIYTVLRARG